MSEASSAGTTADEDRLTTVFRLLSRPRRRLALYELRESDGGLAVERLAEHLAAREVGSDDDSRPPNGTVENPDDPERERVLTSLRHVHLPKLAAAGAVERGPEGAVRYDAGDALDEWVARAAAAEGA